MLSATLCVAGVQISNLPERSGGVEKATIPIQVAVRWRLVAIATCPRQSIDKALRLEPRDQAHHEGPHLCIGARRRRRGSNLGHPNRLLVLCPCFVYIRLSSGNVGVGAVPVQSDKVDIAALSADQSKKLVHPVKVPHDLRAADADTLFAVWL